MGGRGWNLLHNSFKLLILNGIIYLKQEFHPLFEQDTSAAGKSGQAQPVSLQSPRELFAVI